MPALALTLDGKTEYLDETPDNRDDAMRRFWEAGQRGDASASLRRIDAIPDEAANRGFDEPDDDPDPPRPAAPAVPVPVVAGTVSAVAVERIRIQESWLAKAGFALDPPIYAAGTRVLPLGDQKFRLERTRVEHLPLFRDAASAISGAVRTERRRDRTLPLRDIAMTEHGTLLLGEEEVALEIGAFYQLAAVAGFGMGARYLAERCDGELRSANVNTQLARLPDRQVTFRLREADDTTQAYATVTPTYTAVDTDVVLDVVDSALADAHVEMLYDGTGVRATALWMPDQVVDLAAGDIFKAGVRVTTDDTGRGRIRICAVVFRNRCLNLIIIGEGSVETVSAVHKGERSRILDAIANGVVTARSKVADFLDAWGHARSTKTNPENLLRMWVEDKSIHAPGVRDTDAVVQALLDAFHKEPGDTVADAVNAVTRAAHETPWWGVNIREELERQAAQLVYVRA